MNDCKPEAFADRDIHEMLAKRRHVAIIWSTEDVQSVRPDLSDDQSWEVLEECIDRHDCGWGFTWTFIKDVADDLFPRANGGAQP